MKFILLVACMHVSFLTRLIEGSAIQAPLDIISYDDISPEDRKELEYLHHKLGRPKRSGAGSGSGDILQSLKLAIGQGIKNKITEFAKGSAAASARLSSSSSGGSSGHGHSYSPHPPEGHDYKSVDFWSLKKSILNTLLQAVKAIKGGVIAVKGQLIKGSGYLTAATGKLIVAKGDAVTNLGKKIASSAILVPYEGHGHSSSGHGHSSPGHAAYGPPPESHYSSPSASEEYYHGAPSAPASEFHVPEHQYPYHDEKEPSGLLVLKKIQGHDHHHHHHHHVAEESKVPSFKPIGHTGPSFGTIVGKFLSASSSLDPHKPEPFGDTASGSDIHPYHSPHHSDSYHHYEVSESNNHPKKVAPGASGYVVDDDPPTKEEDIEENPSHDSPFEVEPSYLNHNFDEYVGSSSNEKPQTQIIKTHPKPSTDIKEVPALLPSAQALVQNYDYPTLNVQTLGTAPSPSFMGGNYNFHTLPNINDFPNGFPSSSGNLPAQLPKGELPANVLDQTAGQYVNYPSQLPLVYDLTKNSNKQPLSLESSAENHISNEVPNYHNPPPSQTIQNPHSGKHHYRPPSIPHRPTRLTYHTDSAHSSSKYRGKITRSKPKHTSSSSHKRPSSSTRTTTSKHKPKQNYDVVKSIAYELGPNGPKRLT